MAGRGRPPAGEFRERSATLTTRIREELKFKLELSAKHNKRSLSQEIERRLHDSYLSEDQAKLTSGSAENDLVLRVIALALQAASRGDQRSDWLLDSETFDRALNLVVAMLKALRPNTSSSSSRLVDHEPEEIAAATWTAVAEADESAMIGHDLLDQWLGRLKRDAGPLAEHAASQATDAIKPAAKSKGKKP